MTKVSRKGFVDKNGQQVVLKDPTKADKVPGATEGNLPKFDAEGNLQDSGRTIDQSPTTNSANLVTSGGVKTSIDEAVNNIHTLEYKDNSYESRIGVGQLNRDDDELDGATIYGKDAIRIATTGGRVYVDATNIANLQRALKTPSSAPEDDATKLITSKAVYDALQEAEGLTVDSALSPSSTNPVQNKAVYEALAARASYYGNSIGIESDGNGNLPISSNVERDLNEFVSNTEVGKLYNIIVGFYKPNTTSRSYPAIAFWEISSQDDTVVHIYVGDYHFMAMQVQGATEWESEMFDRYKISSFLETF